SQSHFRLGIYQIDIGQAQDMGCQAAVHITSRYAQAQYMVIIVTIEMLHVIGTGRRLVIAIRSSLTIFGIINKPQIIKSALVLPEIIVYITCHHHSSLTTGIRIRTRLRTFQSGNSKCILQINRSEERRVGKECRSRWAAEHGRKQDEREGGQDSSEGQRN